MAKWKVKGRGIRFEGRQMVEGDEFEAPEDHRDMKYLVALKRVEMMPAVPSADEASGGEYERRDMRARARSTRRRSDDEPDPTAA